MGKTTVRCGVEDGGDQLEREERCSVPISSESKQGANAEPDKMQLETPYMCRRRGTRFLRGYCRVLSGL